MRNQLIDLTKVIFSLFVVAIHASVLFPLSSEYKTFFVNGIFRVAVPFFVVISSYFVSENINEWAKKLFKLYAFWSAIYFFSWSYELLFFGNFNWKYFSITLTKNMIFGYHHLWYLAAIIPGLIIHSYIERIFSRKIIIYASVFLYLCGFFAQEYSSIMSEFEKNKSIIRFEFLYKNFVFYTFPIIAMTSYFKKINPFQFKGLTSLNVVIVLFIVFLFEVYFRYYFGLSSKADFLLTTPLFSFFLVKYLHENTISKQLYMSKYFSTAATRIYFIHPIVIKLFGCIIR